MKSALVRMIATTFMSWASFLTAIMRPGIYLWPWWSGALTYAVFVASDQGLALAQMYRDVESIALYILVVITSTWLIVVIGGLLALVAAPSIASGTLSKSLPPGGKFSKRSLELSSGSLWIVCSSLTFGACFAHATNNKCAWVAVGTLLAASTAAAVWLVSSANHSSSLPSRWLASIHRHRIVLAVVAFCGSLVPLAIGASIAVTSPVRLADGGALLVCMVGLASVCTLFGVVLMVIPMSLGQPWMGGAIVVLIIAREWFQPLQIDEDNYLLRARAAAYSAAEKDDVTCKTMPGSLSASLSEHSGDTRDHFRGGPRHSGDRYKIVPLVSAEGGGIRAAYWTALNLAQMDISSNEQFGEEVASLSGVSGGSLGIATWLAARERLDLSPTKRLELIDNYLGSDFLSPLIGGFLFLDVPRLLFGPMWPSARRDQVFELALADKWKEIGLTDFFARQYFGLCLRSFKRLPTIYFNATDALTGQYVYLSNSGLPYIWPFLAGLDPKSTSISKATVAQIVHISARFPYLSPAAQVGEDVRTDRSPTKSNPWAEGAAPRDATSNQAEYSKQSTKPDWSSHVWFRRWVLVDGGYNDNTGLTPAKRAIEYIKDAPQDVVGPGDGHPNYWSTKIRIVHLSNDPGSVCIKIADNWRSRANPGVLDFLDKAHKVPICEQELNDIEASISAIPFQWFTTPVNSMLSVRTDHSASAFHSLLVRHSNPDRDVPDVQFISLKDTMQWAYGDASPERKSNQFLLTEKDQHDEVLHMRNVIELLNQDGKISKATADAYLVEVRNWESQWVAARKQYTCYEKFTPLAPPLGWTLNNQNRELMKCLAFRVGLSSGFGVPIRPVLPQ